MNATSRAFLLFAAVVTAVVATSARQTSPSPNQSQPPAQAQAAQPAIDGWRDDFDGDKLDETKWEPYSFEGGGGKVEVKDKMLKMHGSADSRAGVRSRQTFRAERFYVEATLTKVGPRASQPGEESFQPGFAILAVLFDGQPANRLEWILRSDGKFEAWQSVDGRMTKVDNGKLATKEKSPRLGIARKDEKIYFMLNGQPGLESSVRGVSQNFKVMLYGFGSTENSWDSVSVQTLKKP
jgi:hypothetical protein